MSQKPKAGARPRIVPVRKVVPKKTVAAAAPAVVKPIAPVVEEIVSTVAEEIAHPMIEESVLPAIEEIAEPVLEAVASAEESLIEPLEEAPPAETLTETVVETLQAPAEMAAETVAEIIPVVADSIPTAAVEAIMSAPTIKPTKPNPIQGIKTMMKTTEEFVAFGQANMEALVKSGQIWSTGVQELTKQFATTAKASFEESVSTLKAIGTAKSVKEAMELQSCFAKTAFEKAVAESKHMTDASIKLTEQTLAPITARVTVAVETFGKAA